MFETSSLTGALQTSLALLYSYSLRAVLLDSYQDEEALMAILARTESPYLSTLKSKEPASALALMFESGQAPPPDIPFTSCCAC